MEKEDFSKLWYLKRINLLTGLSEEDIILKRVKPSISLIPMSGIFIF
jgi:hypothetical protein